MLPLREISINSWDDYLRITLSDEFVSWGFRGQADSSWLVESTLSRYFKNFKVNPGAWPHQEERIIRIFKRKAHHYLKNIPSDDDIVQWLSIMQHHGAPTRLIDFTWSPFVAAYFALSQSVKESAVWAIYPAGFDYQDKITLHSGSNIWPRKYWPESYQIFKQKFLRSNIPFVVQGEPNAMNDRLIAQSGTFAIPSVIDLSLEQILLNYPNSDNVLVKFVLDTKQIRDKAMSYMHVTNINESTLFPGIDGMARSLAYELEYNWAYNPKTMKKVPGYKTPTYGFPPGVTD